jgi:hypothetical protein
MPRRDFIDEFVLDLAYHALRGNHQTAIHILRQAVDSGWRSYWWTLRHPLYDDLLEEPEWVELIIQLETDIAKQRQWYEEHKDVPLF